MNIITQKDVFAEDQNKPLRRTRPNLNRRQSSNRLPNENKNKDQNPENKVGGNDSTNQDTSNQDANSQNTNNQGANIQSVNKQGANTQSNTSAQEKSTQAPKTVFYQAARPRRTTNNPQTRGTTDQRTNQEPRRPREHSFNQVRTPKPAQINNNRPSAPVNITPAGPMFTGQSASDTRHSPFSSFISRNPQLANTKLRIIPLGGLEEIGKNMTIFEYGSDIFIVDMGLMFPDYDMLGVDYIIPDVSYLNDKKDRIRGIFVTHGHLDHTGALPYLIEKVGFPPIYGTQVTIGMIKQRLEEFGLMGRSRLITVESDKDVIQLGVFRVFPFHLVHSIPGAVGLEIETPNGRIVLATDWKFDYTPAGGKPANLQTIASIGARGVDLLLSDSTNAEKPGHSISERAVQQALESAVSEAPGRVIIAMFASNISRIQQALNIAHKLGRKVMILGRSMQQNIEMAVSIKAIEIPPNTLIAEREGNRFNPEQLMVICTGSQGEDRSALMRMANGEHKVIKIKKGDTVVISASPIPGNEKSVNGIMDILYKAGAMVVYNKILDVHSSGHAYAEDLKLMIALIRPKYFAPLHGERSKLIVHGKLAKEVGVNPDNIIIGENGSLLEINNQHEITVSDEKIPAGYIMVDGLGVGDVGSIVIRDRQAMAQEGIFVVITVFDSKKRQFVTSPDIISRGFIYMRENEKFVNDIRSEIKKFLKRGLENKTEINQLKNELRDYISKLLYEKTERNPMVIPVMIEI